MDTIPPSWSKADVAKAWCVSPKAIDQLVKDGKVGYYKAGRSRRFFAEHVNQIRAALEQDAAPVEPGALLGLTNRSARRRVS